MITFLPQYSTFTLAGCFWLTLVSCGETASMQSPIAPQEAISTFRLPKGYRIELVASEPLISDPVEIAFDEVGRMYVVQMDDYPSREMNTFSPGSEPKSKIMLLEDKDEDGFYESGSVFTEGLRYANGVMPWKGGVLVSSAPDILFLKDTDNDGKADVQEVVATGFALSNPQLRMSSLRYGLDGWIYGAYSRAGGGGWREEFRGRGNAIIFPNDPDSQSFQVFPGTNFRLRPDKFAMEPSGGMSQFGLSFDEAGNQFTNWNNVHIRHVVINDRYLQSNPYLDVSATMADISDHGNAASVYGITQNMLNLHESEIGHFTSACGICTYTGGLFRDEYANAAFVCEPVANIVHADILLGDGATFSARRAEQNKEFLASTDSWFRPVNLTIGPEGALYVVDFYRKLVEHPDWLSMSDSSGFYTHAGKLKETDFLEGNDRGRIYKIVPESYQSPKIAQSYPGKADIRNLVDYLDHPNSWWRLNAQRLLVSRADLNVVPVIKDLLRKELSPQGRIHALWTLENLGALSDSLLLEAFENPDARVRKQAAVIAETRIEHPGIFQQLLKAAADTDPHVQLQVALTLSTASKNQPDIFQALSGMMKDRIGDLWFQTAVLLSASNNAVQWYDSFRHYAAKTDAERRSKNDFLKKIASISGAKQQAGEIADLVQMISASADTGVIISSLRGIATGLSRHSKSISFHPKGQQALLVLVSSENPAVGEAAFALASHIRLKVTTELTALMERSKVIAEDNSLPSASRISALRILGFTPMNIPLPLLKELIGSTQPEEIQLSAFRILLRRTDNPAVELTLNQWGLLSPKQHQLVESSFLSNKLRLPYLLAAIERGAIKREWVSRNTQNRILKYADTSISIRAGKLFTPVSEENRQKVIHDYNVATTSAGDAGKGKAVFLKTCSICHLLEKQGMDFGPDLQSVSHQTKINLLTMILHPNNDIAAGYEGYTIETKNGQSLTGIIANESDGKLNLKTAGGTTQTILKADIKSISPMAVSLMPEGLESAISKGDMTNLLEYIKTLQ